MKTLHKDDKPPEFVVVTRGYALNWSKGHQFCDLTVSNQTVGYYPDPYKDMVMVITGDRIPDKVKALSEISPYPIEITRQSSGTIKINIIRHALRRQIIHLKMYGKWYDLPLLWRLTRDYLHLNQWYNQHLEEMSSHLKERRLALEEYIETVPPDNRYREHGQGYLEAPKTPMIYSTPYGTEVWSV